MPSTRFVASTRESAQIQLQHAFGRGRERLGNSGNGKLESESLDHAQEQSHCIGRPKRIGDGTLSLSALDETCDPRRVLAVNLRKALLQAWILQSQVIREHELCQRWVAFYQSHVFKEHATEHCERRIL